MPLERLVTEERAAQLFNSQGTRQIDVGLAERLAALKLGDTFIIDPIPPGLTSRTIKVVYNQCARLAGIHLHWRRTPPLAAQVVSQPTADELSAERKRVATRRRRAERIIITHDLNGLVDHQVA